MAVRPKPIHCPRWHQKIDKNFCWDIHCILYSYRGLTPFQISNVKCKNLIKSRELTYCILVISSRFGIGSLNWWNVRGAAEASLVKKKQSFPATTHDRPEMKRTQIWGSTYTRLTLHLIIHMSPFVIWYKKMPASQKQSIKEEFWN